MESEFYGKLVELLKTDSRFVEKETGELLKSEVINTGLKLDKKLIADLLSVAEFKEKFFMKIGEALVFDTNLFQKFLQDKKFLSNSYTDFKNKIGLNIDGKYLKERGEVALVFPFKDCVLAGGMTKEEQKRDEIFFNEILAQDEIDRLLAPKVFSNLKKFTASGESKIKDFQRDEAGTIKDNLIIKGNNLLTLHSLMQEFQGKVKLIYIDPPYNTGNDGFKYNDNFNHSTWLTFMKNRLEVARKLLRDDGVIFVQCDDNEQAYLKILMDEIFINGFLNTISVKAKVSAGASGGGEDKRIKKNIEYIHCYYKGLFMGFNDAYKETEIESYIESMKNDSKSFKYTQILISTGNKKYLKTIKDGSGRDIKIYQHDKVITKTVAQIGKENNLTNQQVYKKYFAKIFTTTNAQSSIRQRVWDSVGEGNKFYSIEYIPKSGRDKGKLITQYYTGNKKVLLIWFSSTAFINTKGNVIKKEKYGTFWDGIDYNNLSKEGETFFPSGKKPEQLLQRIIEMSTEENDLVLDFQLGSGTTCAVAHKMSRQYIGIEQLDYGKNDSVVRLKNVLKGDSTGISKAVDWKGGGEFVYFELKKYNQEAVEKLDKAKSTEELLRIWQEMCERYFLNYDVDIKKFNENQEDFKKLPMMRQKQYFLEMLNKNQLYVNLSEMEDSQFEISEEDKSLTKKFYRK